MGWLLNMLGVGGVVDAVSTAFGYNRENFLYDRKQRQEFEYQVIDMRLVQTGLWREDVRDVVGLTGRKIEVYLTFVAFELTFAVCALCKARCPHGSPPWLIHCHTLSLMSAFMYLFLSVWLGMHAFVAAQAYKVRILTQLVRLPIPTWRQLEGTRTYLSQFERTKAKQMLRVPFATGRQEQHSVEGAADPWGLERRGDAIPELAPDVNVETEKQRHIWLVREAAMFYQTYDAFCRICMSAGTSSLATFFSYFCISYVLTENAAVTGAFCGMLVFVTMSLVIFGMDLLISTRYFVFGGILLYLGPVLTAIVAFWNSRQRGDPGRVEWLMPIALFVNGLWSLYYLWLFRVKETLGGQLLPLAFRSVLYIDVFGWAKHAGNWWRRLPNLGSRGHLLRRNSERGGQSSSSSQRPTLASADCVASGGPVRPEDVTISDAATASTAAFSGSSGRRIGFQLGGQSMMKGDSMRPASFVPVARNDLADDDTMLRSGSEMKLEKPGQLPWKIFSVTTQFLALCWWIAACIEIGEIHGYSGLAVSPNYGLREGVVQPAELLQGGVRVEVKWPSELTRPHGLACTPGGATFLTFGYTPEGSKGLLLGQVVEDGAGELRASERLRFVPAPNCPEVGKGIQDLDFRECQDSSTCNAVILPEEANKIVDCQLRWDTTSAAGALSLPLAQEWLQEGAASSEVGGAIAAPTAENATSVTLVPCPRSAGKCLVLGTTHHRLVHMEVGEVESNEEAAEAAWVPRHLLESQHSEPSGPGTLAAIGGSYLAVLHRSANRLHMLDLSQGGSLLGVWQLPTGHAAGATSYAWSSICAGGDSLYALESGDAPNLWRFPLARNGLAVPSASSPL